MTKNLIEADTEEGDDDNRMYKKGGWNKRGGEGSRGGKGGKGGKGAGGKPGKPGKGKREIFEKSFEATDEYGDEKKYYYEATYEDLNKEVDTEDQDEDVRSWPVEER